MKPSPNLVGRIFSRLTVVRKISNPGEKCKWECRCSCGNTSTISTGSLIRSDRPTRSCGCLKKELAGTQVKKLPDIDALVRRVYNVYRSSAKKRGISFNIPINSVKELIFKDCFYCGKSPSNNQIYNHRQEHLMYGGIDRVDNSKGYEIDNIVPCCKDCNYIKQSIPIFIAEKMMEFINNDRNRN